MGADGNERAVCAAQVGWGSAGPVALVMGGDDRCLEFEVALGEVEAQVGAEAELGVPERALGPGFEAGW